MRHEAFMKLKADEDRLMDEFYTKELGKKSDMVNSPPHYNKAGIETIDAIMAATDEGSEYYLQGNIIKYVWRYRYKNGVEDLEKAQWYLSELIDELKNDKKSIG